VTCVLCHQHIDLWDLDKDGVGGLPAHVACAEPYRAELAAVLDEATALVLAEPDRRRHRHHLRPAS
jgi:hypothetical protein